MRRLLLRRATKPVDQKRHSFTPASSAPCGQLAFLASSYRMLWIISAYISQRKLREVTLKVKITSDIAVFCDYE